MGRKLGGGLCTFGKGELRPYLTQCGQGEAYVQSCMSSFSLIHPTVWPQYTNVTGKQDRTDNGLIA